MPGNDWRMLPDAGRVTNQRPWQHPFDHQDAPCAAGRWGGDLPHGQRFPWRVIAAQMAPRDRRGPR